ncbi:flagellar hook-length control protein [Mycobacterium kansasii]
MTTLTKRDAIESAMSIADAVAQGRVSPSALETAAVAQCRALFGTVVGDGDPLWDLQLDVARQVLGLDGIPAAELSEWLAVARHRAGEPVGQPDADQTPPEVETLPSVALSAESADAEPEPPAESEPAPVTPQSPQRQRRADRYDALAGWSPGSTRRN